MNTLDILYRKYMEYRELGVDRPTHVYLSHDELDQLELDVACRFTSEYKTAGNTSFTHYGDIAQIFGCEIIVDNESAKSLDNPFVSIATLPQ